MKIEKITLRNFRGVTESTVEFGPGVTIVAGPNEVGKTSIAEAIRVLRTMKHSSKAGPIRSLQPVGKDVGPEVEMEFTARGHHVWVRKQWLRDAATELRISGASNEQHTGDAAHDRLTSFLAETIDVDLFDALEIQQGNSLESAQLAGLRSLSQALDTSSAPVADHDELIERIESEYGEHFTPTGRPKGRYQQSSKALEELAEELRVARESSREMERFTAEVERESNQLASDAADLREAKKNLEERKARDEALAGLREAVKNAEQTAENSAAAVAGAHAAMQARAALRTEAQEREEKLTEVNLKLAATEKEITALDEKGQELLTARDKARAAYDAAREAAKTATKDVNAATDRHELAALGDRLEAAREAQQRRLEAARIIDTNRVDQELLQKITSGEADLQIARAAQDSATARVRIHPLGQERIEADGREIAGEQEILVTDPVVIEASGVVRMEVQPGALPEDLRRRVRQAEDELADLLAEGQVESVAEAREVAVSRADAKAEQNLAAQALASALGEESLEELQEKHAVLHARMADTPEEVEPDSDIAALRAAAEEANEEVHQGEAALASAQQELDTHAAKAGEFKESLIRTQSDHTNHEAELTRVRHTLAAAREAQPDEEIEEALKSAEERAASAETKQREARTNLEAANPEAVEIELANAKEWVENAGLRSDETRMRLEKTKALLEDRAKLGLYDEVQRLEGELRAAEQEHDRLHRRAEAVRLLREVMLRHRDEAHARYVTPFAERIESLGRIVFGADFEVEITPELRIASRTLGGQTVPFESLSAGAREQLGLLGRLAATALVDPLEGAPLILDDTLGFADAERLQSLGAVLNDVGRNAQIIVLTCQPQRFSRVGGAKMVHLSSS